MKYVLFAVCLVADMALFAEAFVLTTAPSSLDDWKNGSFYEGGVAPTGVSTDTIATKFVNKNTWMTIELDGTNENGEDNATFKFLGGMRGIILSNAVLKVTVPAGDVATLNCAVWDNSSRSGTIEKYGDGELYLASRLKVSATSTSPADFECHLHVFDGTVRLTENAETGHQYHTFHSVTIERPAKVITLFNDCVWQMRGLYGEGMITNEASSRCRMYVCEGPKMKDDGGEFFGVIGGNVSVEARGCRFALSGTSNTMSGGVTSSKSYDVRPEVHVRTIGSKADAASSVGNGTVVHVLNAHPFVYDGLGETTDRDFQLNYMNSILSGGTNGNLNIVGCMKRWDATKHNIGLILDGDNLHPCTFAATGRSDGASGSVYSGCFGDFEWTVNGVKTRYNYYMRKRGTGTWYLPFCLRFRNTGVFSVENGTLAFDTLDRAGELTSLGYSTRLYDNVEQPTDDAKVDYAFLLGSDVEGEVGIMECVTNFPQMCTDRPFGLKGKGGFRATSAPVKYANVFGVGSGANTLVLEGSCADECAVYDIVDRKKDGDTATVGIEKNGTGTWVLGGDLTFTGPIAVNGGTLIVRRAAQKYTWYRLMVRNMCKANYTIININEIGLFAADNKPQNLGLKHGASFVTLQPGECAAGWNREFNRNYGVGTPIDPFEQLFDGRRYCSYEVDGGTTETSWHALNGGFRYAWKSYETGVNETNPTNDNPMTWVPIDMHLADDAQPIDHYDIQTGVAPSVNPGNVPNEVQLLASMDGIHWDEASAVNTIANASATATYTWLSTGLTGGGLVDNGTGVNSYTHSAGWKLTNSVPIRVFSMLTNAGPVTVANGATLKYEGDAAGAPTLSKVTLAAGATGSIDGFAFGENGTFEIDAMNDNVVSVAVTLPNAHGLDNVASWSVKVGGVTKSRYRVTARANGFTLSKGGITLSFR